MTKEWVVTTSPDWPINDVKKALTRVGFVVAEVIGEIWCITGSANEDTVEKLRDIPGVIDVSPNMR